MIPTQTLRDAEVHLRKKDRKLARLIEQAGPCTLGQKASDPFHVLCGSIISQQLSIKAADTIQARVVQLVSGDSAPVEVFAPGHFLGVAHEELRGTGLSNSKARWLVGIAQAVHSGALSFAALHDLDDTMAIEALDALPGVGRWTAEMMLIFALDRLDVFSLGDVGLRRSINQIYNKGEKLDDEATLKLSARWAPYRSVASWYLWRRIDADVGTWS